MRSSSEVEYKLWKTVELFASSHHTIQVWARCRCACAIKSQNDFFYTFFAFLIPQFVVFSQFSFMLYRFTPVRIFLSPCFYLVHLHSCSDSHFNAYIRDSISTERAFSPVIFTTILYYSTIAIYFFMSGPRRTRTFGFEISSTNMQYNLSFA